MSKLKLLFFVSMVILIVVVGLALFRPLTQGIKYSEVQQEQLIQTNDRWIVQFKIINQEGGDRKYTISGVIDGKPYTEDVIIPQGRKFTYIHHIYPEGMTDRSVRFAIFKEGEATPFEQITYYVPAN